MTFSTFVGHLNISLAPVKAAARKRIRKPKSRGVGVVACTAEANPKPLVVVGSVCADLTARVDRLPRPGETICGSSLQLFPGGKGANQAAAAAKLGCKTVMIGQVGSDTNADFMLDSMRDCGVDIDLMRRVDGPTGSAMIMLQPSGENSIVIIGGANQAHWKIGMEQKQAISSAGVLLLQREIPDPVNMEVAKIASEAGITVVLDAGGIDTPFPAELFPFITTLSPNETELERLTGMDTSTDDNVFAAASKLMSLGVQEVLVKLGKKGSMLISGGHKHKDVLRQRAYEVPIVMDTTGAGDCFTGAYAVGILEGLTPSEALDFAAAAASISIQKEGAMTSLPDRTEVDKLFLS